MLKTIIDKINAKKSSNSPFYSDLLDIEKILQDLSLFDKAQACVILSTDFLYLQEKEKASTYQVLGKNLLEECFDKNILDSDDMLHFCGLYSQVVLNQVKMSNIPLKTINQVLISDYKHYLKISNCSLVSYLIEMVMLRYDDEIIAILLEIVSNKEMLSRIYNILYTRASLSDQILSKCESVVGDVNMLYLIFLDYKEEYRERIRIHIMNDKDMCENLCVLFLNALKTDKMFVYHQIIRDLKDTMSGGVFNYFAYLDKKFRIGENNTDNSIKDHTKSRQKGHSHYSSDTKNQHENNCCKTENEKGKTSCLPIYKQSFYNDKDIQAETGFIGSGCLDKETNKMCSMDTSFVKESKVIENIDQSARSVRTNTKSGANVDLETKSAERLDGTKKSKRSPRTQSISCHEYDTAILDEYINFLLFKKEYLTILKYPILDDLRMYCLLKLNKLKDATLLHKTSANITDSKCLYRLHIKNKNVIDAVSELKNIHSPEQYIKCIKKAYKSGMTEVVKKGILLGLEQFGSSNFELIKIFLSFLHIKEIIVRTEERIGMVISLVDTVKITDLGIKDKEWLYKIVYNNALDSLNLKASSFWVLICIVLDLSELSSEIVQLVLFGIKKRIQRQKQLLIHYNEFEDDANNENNDNQIPRLRSKKNSAQESIGVCRKKMDCKEKSYTDPESEHESKTHGHEDGHVSKHVIENDAYDDESTKKLYVIDMIKIELVRKIILSNDTDLLDYLYQVYKRNMQKCVKISLLFYEVCANEEVKSLLHPIKNLSNKNILKTLKIATKCIEFLITVFLEADKRGIIIECITNKVFTNLSYYGPFSTYHFIKEIPYKKYKNDFTNDIVKKQIEFLKTLKEFRIQKKLEDEIA